jgi:flagellar biogenesis protein FliO
MTMTPLAGLALVAALALVLGGLWLLRQPGGNKGPGRTKAVLMMVAGLVVAFNAWVTSLPVPG